MFAIICGEAFKSKAALQRRVQAVLAKGFGAVSFADHVFLVELFQRHPSYAQKKGVGILEISVTKAEPYNTRCFQIERIDGTRTDISYIECLKPSTVYNWFPAACRTAVVGQIQAAKNAAFASVDRVACPFTGESLTRETAHVDHAPPWGFDDIVAAFLDESAIDLPRVAFVDGDGQTESRFADRELADAFAKFHAERAVLRVVGRYANLSLLRRRG